MPETLDSLRLRLLFEYAHLVDWADLVGLAEPDEHETYNLRLKANRAMIYAALCELQREVQAVVRIVVKYTEAEAATATGDATPGAREDVDDATVRIDPKNRRFVAAFSQSKSEIGTQEVLRAADLEPFNFESFNAHSPPTKSKSKRNRGAQILLKVFSDTKSIASQPKRLLWATHHRDSFKEHLERIQELTAFLQSTSDCATQQLLVEMGRESCLSLVAISSAQGRLETNQDQTRLALATIQKRLECLQADVTLKSTIDIRVTQHATMHPTPDFESLLKFNMLRQHTDQMRDDESPIASTLCALGDIDFRPGQSGERRSIGSMANIPVAVEWKTYIPISDPDNDDGPYTRLVPAHRVTLAVQQLCAMLQSPDKPTDLHIPSCIGYVHDYSAHRYGFVFHRSLDAMSEISLGEGFQRERPGLKSRIMAAQVLTSSLLYLHAVGWLHKAISSTNVLITYSSSGDIQDARLAGFEYARSDDIGYTTTDPEIRPEVEIYNHPEFQGMDKTGFRKTFDIYSLGVILIELAYWQPISSILGFSTGATADRRPTSPDSVGRALSPGASHARRALSPGINDVVSRALSPAARSRAGSMSTMQIKQLPLTPETLRRVRGRILEDPAILGGVRNDMGELYCNAVEACIRGGKALDAPDTAQSEAHPIAGTLIQMAYTKQVVGALKGIVV